MSKENQAEQPENSTDTQEPHEVAKIQDEAEGAQAEEVSADEATGQADEDLVAELAHVQSGIQELKDENLRLQAEMQNIRRRAQQDVEKAHKFGLEKFVNEMLPILDSLERAAEACQSEDESVKALRDGVDMTLNMFLASLKKFNVEQIDPNGQPFDPAFHQAMSMVDNPEVEPNTVVAVMQKGYSLNDRLIRPAMVMVSKSAS